MGRNLFDGNQEREDGINGTEARLPNESREQENSTNDAKGYDLFADFMPQSESIGYAFPAGVIPKRHKKPEWNDSTLPPLDLVTIFSTDLELTNAEEGIRTQKISRNLNEMAKAICRRFKFALLSGNLAVYKPPCWKIMDSQDVSRFIAETVKDLFPDDTQYLSSHQYGEIYFHIQNHEDTIKLEATPAPDYHYLCCRDYLYDWASGECIAHDSSHLRFSTLAFDAEEIGNCSGEYWERFLEDLTDGNDDLRQRILEVIGVILSGYPSKSFFLLEGESGTGKSQFANFLRDILGNDTCFALNDISQLGGRWATGSLFGKLLCVCGDVPNAPLTSAAIGTIKQLTGGDLIRGEQKYKEHFLMSTAKKRRYEYKITLGKDIDGKLIRKSFYSTKSRADAKKKAEEFRLKYEMETCLCGESTIKAVKFADWSLSCLEMYKKPYVKANTYHGTYFAPLNQHLIPYFGQMNIADIRPIHIQRYINQAAEKYAPETVKKDYNILNLIFQTAVDNQLCTKSPMVKSIKLPKYETRAKKQAYTQEQYDLVYAFAEDWENGLSIMLLLETGISRSELLGLRWEDLDTDNRCLRINQGLVTYHSEDVGKSVTESSGLKNKFRQRAVPIVKDTLWERLCAIPRTIFLGGQAVKPENIFYSPEGKPYQPNNWANRVYRPFMQALHRQHPEVPMLSPHELRHTRATLWIANGIEPYMAARLLGHSDLKMLTKIYDHTSEDTLRSALLQAGGGTTAPEE